MLKRTYEANVHWELMCRGGGSAEKRKNETI